MARQKQRSDRPARNQKKPARTPEEAGEVGGFVEESHRGAEEPAEWPKRISGPDDNAPDYETPGGVQRVPAGTEPEARTGPVHDVSFRPAPGGYIETEGRQGRRIPFTGEVISTRDSNFEEDPDTGRTAAEEEGEFITESLEERTRGFESG